MREDLYTKLPFIVRIDKLRHPYIFLEIMVLNSIDCLAVNQTSNV